MTTQSDACTRPPEGWTCPRGKDHEGPCAASPTEPAICQTCSQPHPHPGTGFMPKHPFNDGSVPVSHTFGKRRPDGSRGRPEAAQQASQGHQPPPLPPMPFDPVLRQALIDKGVLVPEDLRAAEEKIRAVTAAFTMETSHD